MSKRKVSKVELFSGLMTEKGLSNEEALVLACPAEFFWKNEWSNYIRNTYQRTLNSNGWKWQTSNLPERAKQLGCLRGVLKHSSLTFHDVSALAGWMLSQMLTTCPKLILPKIE